MKIIQIPYSENNTGEEKAPAEICRHLGKISFSKIDCDNLSLEDAQKKISVETSKNVQTNEKLIFLGGSHQLSYATIKAIASRHESLGLLLFDAHPDLLENDWLAKLILDGVLEPSNIIIVGARKFEDAELDFLKKYPIRMFLPSKIEEFGIHDLSDTIMEAANEFDALYISIDIDVCDPANAPGTRVAEPGGLSSREILYFIKRLSLMKNLKAVDIVEINPCLDLREMTIKLGARIADLFSFKK